MMAGENQKRTTDEKDIHIKTGYQNVEAKFVTIIYKKEKL